MICFAKHWEWYDLPLKYRNAAQKHGDIMGRSGIFRQQNMISLGLKMADCDPGEIEWRRQGF